MENLKFRVKRGSRPGEGRKPQAISRTSLSKNGGTLSELQGIDGSKEQKDGRKGVPSEIAVWQPGKEGTEEGAGEGLSSRKLGEDRLHAEALDLEPDGEKTPFRTSEEAGGVKDTIIREGIQGENPRVKGKKQKVVKQAPEANLILRVDVRIEEAIEVAESTVVGRARGKVFSIQFIQNWAEQQWQKNLGEAFKVSGLAKDWFMIQFDKKEMVDWVLE